MTIRPPTRLPHLRRLGAATTGLLLAGALVAPQAALAVGLPPFALDDAITTNEDTADTGNVLDNDFNFNTSAMTVTAYTPVNPTFGVLVIAANGNYTFTPTANWHGTTTTTYTAHNDQGNDNATIHITVSSVNDAPVAGDDTIPAVEDTTTPNVSALLRANDTDVDGDTLTITSVSGSTGGTATRSGGGATVTFAPSANLCGNGAGGFDYTISDGHGGTDSGHVTVNIVCVDDAPVANDDTTTVTEDTATDVTAAILANDTDIDGDTLVVSEVANAASGTVDLVGGVVTFTPAANACGTGIGGFDYTADDGAGGTDTAHVIVNITCVNDAPVATDDSASGTEDGDIVVTAFDMLGNDSDVEGDALSVTAVEQRHRWRRLARRGRRHVHARCQRVRHRRRRLRLHGRRRQRRHRHGPRHHRHHLRQRQPARGLRRLRRHRGHGPRPDPGRPDRQRQRRRGRRADRRRASRTPPAGRST